MRSLYALSLWAGLLTASGSWALATDRDQPIDIEADQAEVDDQKGVTIYQGAVVITQGSIRIQADQVTLHYDAGHELERAVAVGAPARFRQQPDTSSQQIRAQARRLEYHAKSNQIVLMEDASVVQAGDRVSGMEIVYDTESHQVKARRGKEAKDRVRVTISPRPATPEGRSPESGR